MEKRRIFIVFFIILVFIVAIILSFLYYKNKYIVSFESGTDEVILNQYVSRKGKVVEPKSPKKEGYVFIEWQLNGNKYDFDSEVYENIVLTAKWIKEEYITINYETNSNYSIEPIKILKGSEINNLPVAYKDGYEFVGWYLNGKLYSNEIINDDITLYAEYKKNEKEYNVGDKVIIIGNYSESAYSKDAYYSAAYGWDREVLYIIENSEHPYAVGNENGVTGFFKSESIKLIEGVS